MRRYAVFDVRAVPWSPMVGAPRHRGPLQDRQVCQPLLAFRQQPQPPAAAGNINSKATGGGGGGGSVGGGGSGANGKAAAGGGGGADGAAASATVQASSLKLYLVDAAAAASAAPPADAFVPLLDVSTIPNPHAEHVSGVATGILCCCSSVARL